MRTTVQRWGNSLALRIPKSFATDAEIGEGSLVELSLTRGALVVRPVPGQHYKLAALLAAVKPGNLHPAVDTGNPVGREAW